ncbi:hypothetical protein CONCODRAFT_12826 [Conidiobolus coronatus NRRL 28638]|uniref:Uncharacterized protein n=1 Tax=Conidiobolus coronatus (strain ATCC 28846 / CBS 209.66 / NRRL 28638) TaxID=796925 RepID=A0A137NS90_CONC2|nr:hypothetical protein CONCODRAFT_12826 [Conidiobolus coronatus NRRL 28638]|eukprot:KXN65550.1 hypothetical protein CONCODRAFT_12826 [Conidiobolus coronatus NRRL 28638]
MAAFTKSIFAVSMLLVSMTSGAPVAPNAIGNNLQVIGLASQNSANNNGNTSGSASHSSGTQNVAQQIVADQQSIDVLKNIDVAENPLTKSFIIFTYI